VHFGIALGRMHPSMFVEAAVAADELGYASLWFPEHLVLPGEMAGSPFAGADHPPIPPPLRFYDVFAYLGFLAARTSRIRLGTHVYNLALRHPFVSARAIQTVDVVSGGRLEVGIGAGWLQAEWLAAGLDFASRGARLDEALEVSAGCGPKRSSSTTGSSSISTPSCSSPSRSSRPIPGDHRWGVTGGAATGIASRRMDRTEPHACVGAPGGGDVAPAA